MQKQWENDPRVVIYKKIFKVFAVLIVFIVSFSIPVFIFNDIKNKAESLRIKTEINQAKLWAEVYGLEKGTYKGLEKDEEINKIMLYIKYLGASSEILIKDDDKGYCINGGLKNKENWCVDYTGFVGEGICLKDSAECD